MRTKKEIEKYLDITTAKVSLVRKIVTINNIMNGEDFIPPGVNQDEWKNKRLELVRAGIEDCHKRLAGEEEHDFVGEYEYNEGIMAALRWVLGEEKNLLDT